MSLFLVKSFGSDDSSLFCIEIIISRVKSPHPCTRAGSH